MAPSTSNAGVDVDETLTVAQPDLATRNRRFTQGIASSLARLDAIENELVERARVLREQGGPVPGRPNGAPGRTVSLRSSVSHGTPGLVSPTVGGGGIERLTSDSGHLSPPERLPDVLPDRPRQPPSNTDRITLTHPNASLLQGNLGNERPTLGRPLYFPFENGQPFNLPPTRHPVPYPDRPVEVDVFDELRDPTGRVVGFVRRGSLPLSANMGSGFSARQLPPISPHIQPQIYRQAQPQAHRPQMSPHVYPHTLPQVYPQMPPQIRPQMNPRINPRINSQMPPQVHPQIPPQMQSPGPRVTSWGAPTVPPPPFEPTPGADQAGPSTTQRRASRTSGTLAAPQRESTGRVPMRANPARRNRSTKPYESE